MSKTQHYIQNDVSLRKKEKIQTQIFQNSKQASKFVAQQIRDLIIQKQQSNSVCVLGLATGSTPVGVYNELIYMHKNEGLSFKNVATFNLDEYYPIEKENPQSYHYYMHKKLFDHIDISPQNINIPDGTIHKSAIFESCRRYETKIQEYGGLDFQLLGIGRTGHIGFNEPGSDENSLTRLINLDKVTRSDAASDFQGIDNVPQYAITMGIKAIMAAKKVIIMAFSSSKSDIVLNTIEGEVSVKHPATFLQNHQNADFVLDLVAAEKLSRFVCPWTVKEVNTNSNFIYDEYWTKRAVIWLSFHEKKPILRLVNNNFEDNGLLELLVQHNRNACLVSQQVFQKLQAITTQEPGQFLGLQTKRILVFSPCPGDDVMCMGGTILKLSATHDVSVCYMTSGNKQVFDFDVLRYCDFMKEYQKTYIGKVDEKTSEMCHKIQTSLKTKVNPTFPDIPEVRTVKTLIRRSEGRIALKSLGIQQSNIHFLDLNFYEVDESGKKPLAESDFKLVQNLLNQCQPDVIFAQGDITGYTGIQGTCLQAIIKSLDQQKLEESSKPKLYLYRGNKGDFNLQDVDFVVCLSPEDMIQKRTAMLKHCSQKDKYIYPGGQGEYWQKAEQRSSEMAEKLKYLGQPVYEGVECFADYYEFVQKQ